MELDETEQIHGMKGTLHLKAAAGLDRSWKCGADKLLQACKSFAQRCGSSLPAGKACKACAV